MSNKELGHLVITRNEGGSVLIGEDIRIEVQWITGGQCSLSITAPKTLRILRGELLAKGAKLTPPNRGGEG